VGFYPDLVIEVELSGSDIAVVRFFLLRLAGSSVG